MGAEARVEIVVSGRENRLWRIADTADGVATDLRDSGRSWPAPHLWNPSERPTYLTVMSPAGFERHLLELAYGLRHVATEEDAAALRERPSEVCDITVVGPPPPRTY